MSFRKLILQEKQYSNEIPVTAALIIDSSELRFIAPNESNQFKSKTTVMEVRIFVHFFKLLF